MATSRRQQGTRGQGSALRAGLVALAALLGTFLLYAPALQGEFVSDDQHYVEKNPYVHDLRLENAAEILRPGGAVTRLVENYAPVHVLLHGLAWQVFGDDVRGHHAVNVAMHVVVAGLLLLVFRRAGFSARASGIGSLLFLVHPANVEAVAWISQLKTTSSLALALMALLAHPRRPVLAAGLFGLALLAKPIAAFALPVVAARACVGAAAPAGAPEAGEQRRAAWLAAWAALLSLFAFVELGVFRAAAGSLDPGYLGGQGPWGRLADGVALVGRYAVMALTGFGTSAFHEPPPVTSLLDPWLLAGVATLLAVATRSLVALRRRSGEVVFWVWAGAAYFPVSQLFPFPFPMADRYLYFVLPGVYGVLVFVLRDLVARLGRAGAVATRRLEPALVVTLLLVSVGFAWRSHERARLWSSHPLLLVEAALNYPQGKSASMLRARQAAQNGDVETALAELRRLMARGYNRFDVLLTDGSYGPIRDDPRFRALMREMASWWIERLGQRESLTQLDLYMVALSHEVRGEREAEVRALERALEVGGPSDDAIRERLERVR
jgi:hypothetical protein